MEESEEACRVDVQNPGPVDDLMRRVCKATLMQREYNLARVQRPNQISGGFSADPTIKQIPIIRIVVKTIKGLMHTLQQLDQRRSHLPGHRGATSFANGRTLPSKITAKNVQRRALLQSKRTGVVVCAVAEAAREDKIEAEPVQEVGPVYPTPTQHTNFNMIWSNLD